MATASSSTDPVVAAVKRETNQVMIATKLAAGSASGSYAGVNSAVLSRPSRIGEQQNTFAPYDALTQSKNSIRAESLTGLIG